MFKKKRLIVIASILIAIFGMTMYAGTRDQNETIATRVVKFMDGQNNSEISLQKVEVGKEAQVPDSPTYDNLVFLGWFDNNDSAITNFSSITKDITVTAKYGADINKNGIADANDTYYDVTFYDTVTRTNISTDRVLTGMNANSPRVPTHGNYTFLHWSRTFENVTSNITVNAMYREITVVVEPTEYHVVFYDGKTNDILKEADVEQGSTVTIPANKTYEKTVFLGWFDAKGNEFKASTIITDHTTVTATYAADINNNGKADSNEDKFTITFATNGNGTLEGTTKFENILVGLDFNNTITIPTPIAKTGYTFIRWEEALPEEGTKITGNVTYTAIFEDNTLPSGEVIDIWSGNKTYKAQRFATAGIDVTVRFQTSEPIQKDLTEMTIAGIKVTKITPVDPKINGENVYQGTVKILKTTSEGLVEFSIKVTDLEDNEGVISNNVKSKHTVTVDKTIPGVEVSTPVVGDYNPEKFIFSTEDANGLDRLDYTIRKKGMGELKQSGELNYKDIKADSHNYSIKDLLDGEYELRISVRDLAGNSNHVSPIYFTVDNKAPDATLKYNTELTKGNVKVVLVATEIIKNLIGWETEDNITFTKTYMSNIEENLEIEDLAGNKKTISFNVNNIDKNNPLIKINDEQPKEFYNINAEVIATDLNFRDLTLYKLTKYFGRDHRKELSGNVAISEGEYLAIATDKVDNTTEVSFVVDKTNPVVYGNFSRLKTGENIFTRSVKITVAEKYLDKVMVNGNIYNNKIITEDGVYTVTAIDKAGNSVTRTFIIDKNKPIIKINENKPKEIYNEDANVTAEDNNLSSLVVMKVTKTGKWVSNVTNVTENGHYFAIAEDKAGNKTIVEFKIDKTAPTITVKENTKYKTYTLGDKENKIFTQISFDITDNSLIRDIELNGTLKTINTTNKSYYYISVDKNGGILGVNIIKVRDIAGNETIYTFNLIGNNAPTITLDGGIDSGDYAQKHTRSLVVEDIDGNIDNSSLYYVWTNRKLNSNEEIVNAINNDGILFTSGDNITTHEVTGNYYLAAIAKDTAGNIVTYSSGEFKVDLTKPEINKIDTELLTITVDASDA